MRLESARVPLGLALLLAVGVTITIWLWPGVGPVGDHRIADLLDDRAREIHALDTEDASVAGGYLAGNALIGLAQNVDTERGANTRVRFLPAYAALALASAPDPRDPSVTTRVEARGLLTLEFLPSAGGDVIRSERRSFDDLYWLARQGDRWVIVDEAPSSRLATVWDELIVGGWLPRVASLAATSLLGFTFIIARRRREVDGGVIPDPSRPAPTMVQEVAARLPGGGGAEGFTPGDTPAVSVAARPRGRIRVLGALTITDADGRDLTPELLSRPVTAFLWLYLLIWAIESPGRWVSRALLADETFPRLPPEVQRKRLRDRLRDMRTGLPESLWRAVVLDGEQVRLDISLWEVDAVELVTAAAAVDGESNLVRLAEAGGMTSSLLPTWSDIARVTGGRGGAEDFVDDLRQRLSRHQVEAALRLEPVVGAPRTARPGGVTTAGGPGATTGP